MLVPNRHGSSNSYRYGFQGQEKDDEIKGEGNSLNYTFRMHDPRVGRFFAVDPLTHKYPHYTPYSFSGNKVIHAIELEGLEEYIITTNTDKRLRHFKIRPDDNLSVISKVTGVAVNDIIKWNEKALNGNPDLIYAGQSLKLFDDTGLTMKYFVKPKQSNWIKDFVVQLATTNEHGPSIQSSVEAVLIAEGGAGVAEIVINAPKIIRGVTEVVKKLKPSNQPKAPVTTAAPKISSVDDVANIPALRATYEGEVRGLKDMVNEMRSAGKTTEEIARTVSAERRAIGVKYKDLTPPEMLEKIYERNLTKYGDKLGPSVDQLRNQGKSWDDIIESSTRPGGKDLNFNNSTGTN